MVDLHDHIPGSNSLSEVGMVLGVISGIERADHGGISCLISVSNPKGVKIKTPSGRSKIVRKLQVPVDAVLPFLRAADSLTQKELNRYNSLNSTLFHTADGVNQLMQDAAVVHYLHELGIDLYGFIMLKQALNESDLEKITAQHNINYPKYLKHV